MSEPKYVKEFVQLGERVLEDSTHIFEDHDCRREAEELLAHCLGREAKELDEVATVPKRTGERYLSLVARRAGGEPFPFLVGRIHFWGLDLKVRPGAFVPRPSSELLVERAVRRLKQRRDPIVVDVCTGAGPIALGIADDIEDAEVWGTDISEEGLELGRENARRLNIANVSFRRCDMYSGLPKRLLQSVDVITGHIPYVPPHEIEDLPSEVKEHEPLYTLTDHSDDGLHLMRRTVLEAPQWLRPGGWLLLEVSHDLPPKVREVCARAGLEHHGVASDEDDLSVVVEARMKRTGAR